MHFIFSDSLDYPYDYSITVLYLASVILLIVSFTCADVRYIPILVADSFVACWKEPCIKFIHFKVKYIFVGIRIAINSAAHISLSSRDSCLMYDYVVHFTYMTFSAVMFCRTSEMIAKF